MRRSTVITVFFLFVFSQTHATPPNDYYNFSPDNELRDNLFISIEFNHLSMGYTAARQQLFGYLYLNGLTPSTYSLMTTYCQITITNSDLSPHAPLAPSQIPDSKVINTEHVWPQSLFSAHFSSSLQKSDLHILFPELMPVNSLRNNHPFGNVEKITKSPCAGAALGKSLSGRTVFEPHDLVKGDVARALFYFSVRYQSPLDSEQESTLRAWHLQDPVSREEEDHNEHVFLLQRNRNPFIDNPLWVEQIGDF